MTSNNPTQHVTVSHGFRVTVRPPTSALTARSADEALLRAALGLPPDADVVVSTRAEERDR